MEYYISITYNCNLRCSYCSSKRILSPSKELILTNDKMDELIKYISKNNHTQKDLVIFFGGEPLLEYQIIDKFIKRASYLNLDYGLYTNGLLLDNIPLNILQSMNVIFVSVDGDKKSHDKHRGLGTYEKIINNLKTIKPKIDGFILGRITVEEETNIFNSATNIMNYVDGVYWQIVNKPKFNDKDVFINNYKKYIIQLFDFWLYNFKRGKILNIIPFQAIISSLVFNYARGGLSFRCGAGSSFQTIDIYGNIYWCDEYMGDPRGIVGRINGSKPNLLYENHKDIFEDCEKCKISDICLGRCKKCLKEYPKEQIRVYCDLSIFLVETIIVHINEIEKVIKSKNHDLKSLYNAPRCTEEIP